MIADIGEIPEKYISGFFYDSSCPSSSISSEYPKNFWIGNLFTESSISSRLGELDDISWFIEIIS
jgi:hypothetical protein